MTDKNAKLKCVFGKCDSQEYMKKAFKQTLVEYLTKTSGRYQLFSKWK